MTPAEDPSTPSLAYKALAPMWAMIDAILAGAQAVKNAGELYLPKFPAESPDEYTRRKNSAPWRPEFEDAIRSISSKPFTDEVTLAGDPSTEMKSLAEDIDGRGNNLHVFARDMFETGVAKGAHGILIDFPTMAPNATKAQEKAAGARPYWVSVDADEIIALHTERIGAREIVTHLRLKESKTVVNGFEETTEDRIRVIEPGKWEVWKPTKTDTGTIVWVIERFGELTLAEVPFVFYATAERCGPQYVRPPMLDVANMQIELYQQMSGEEQIYTMAGAPMLTANGMAAPTDGGTVQTGPNRVLYAPGAEGITTSWDYVQPNADNLRAISERVRATIEDIKRLGLQPTLPKTGNVTATASGIDAAKGHNAVETWANALKDALEQAFVFTAMWLKSSEQVKVNVHTDFAIGMYGAQELTALTTMRAAGDLSQESLWDEMTRRGVLGPQFDKDEEEQRLLGEDVNALVPDNIDPATGEPIDPKTGRPIDPNNPPQPGA